MDTATRISTFRFDPKIVLKFSIWLYGFFSEVRKAQTRGAELSQAQPNHSWGIC